MNKFLLTLIALGSIIRAVASPEDENAKLAERMHIPIEYMSISDQFYEGMDSVYEKMKNADDSVRQHGNCFQKIQPELNEFFKSKGAELPVHIYNPQAQVSDPDVKSCLDRLRNVKPTSVKSFDSFIDTLGVINLEAKANLTESQMQIVYSASCVKFASTVYWMTNIQKWLELKSK